VFQKRFTYRVLVHFRFDLALDPFNLSIAR
jgi:hypothetical protein